MKRTLIVSAALLSMCSAANAWTDGRGHWVEGPQIYGPIYPGNVIAPYGPPPAYFYGPPPPPPYGYGYGYGYGRPVNPAGAIIGGIIGGLIGGAIR